MIELSAIAMSFVLRPCVALAFDSGSTGVDGDLSPAVTTEIQLPVDGVLNFRSVSIPLGVTVRFKPNATNTPVKILVAEDALIAGSINLDGETAPLSGGPGKGAPGGFDGGFGGLPNDGGRGGNGLGPGGGGAGEPAYGPPPGGGYPSPYLNPGGGGASHATSGQVGRSGYHNWGAGGPGATYGSNVLLPLIGGSGGGGGARRESPVAQGFGGSGGGGALLLAAKGAVTVTGSITAKGGNAAGSNNAGGAGSGGAIRIVATSISITGEGTLNADGGAGVYGGGGGQGRIRLEAENLLGVRSTSPAFTFGSPGPLFVAGQPKLRFLTVADVPVPANPAGFGDVTVPAATANPVSIALATSGIPVGSTIKVSVIPQFAQPISVDSPPTTGSVDTATTSVSLDIPFGNNVLSAQTSFMVLAAVGDALSRFAQGERVEKVTLTSTLGQVDKATLHTVAGRQFEIEPALLQLATLSH